MCAAKDNSDRIQSDADDTFRDQSWGEDKQRWPADREDPADGRTFAIRHLGRTAPPQ